MVEIDTTWTDFEVNSAHAPLLKIGVAFSAYHDGGKFGDVIAIWPSKTAPAPSMVLGAKLK